MKEINILGSGQTSLIAAAMFAQRGFDVSIFPDKPVKQSHFAILRFKTRVIEEELGIALQEVEIKKAISYEKKIYNDSNILFDNLYSQKVTGKIRPRSIGSLGVGKRYIPPINFFDQLLDKCNILGVKISEPEDVDMEFIIERLKEKGCKPNKSFISTLAMPQIYKHVHQEQIKFDFEKVYVLEFELPIDCNVHQTIYFPQIVLKDDPAYRISIVGNQVKFEISEFSLNNFKEMTKSKEEIFKFHDLISYLFAQFEVAFGIELSSDLEEKIVNDCLYYGVDKVIKCQKFGKISAINEEARQSIIYNLTQNLGIYSLGRFACWREKTMIDDVVLDVKKIENWIRFKNLSGYQAMKSLSL